VIHSIKRFCKLKTLLEKERPYIIMQASGSSNMSGFGKSFGKGVGIAAAIGGIGAIASGIAGAVEARKRKKRLEQLRDLLKLQREKIGMRNKRGIVRL
jgi:hypothetical protein